MAAKQSESSAHQFAIPDKRCKYPRCYPPERGAVRRGRMKNSWHIGVRQRRNGAKGIAFEDGLTWGSIGQYLGYLFGEVDEAFQDELYERMERAFRGTDRWVGGGNERE